MPDSDLMWGVPHVELARLPTPVVRLDEISNQIGSEIWCKRDDLTAQAYGGNKTRKLEYLIADAKQRGCDSLVTAGAAGSHHVLATSLWGTRNKLEVHAVLGPQAWSAHVEENLKVDLALGAHVHAVQSYAALPPKMLAIMVELRLRGRRPYFVPPGGSSAVGTLGYVGAALELVRQIENRDLPRPDAIYVAFGTGGTAVGLALGLVLAGMSTPIVAVRITDPIVANERAAARLARKTIQLMKARGPLSIDPRDALRDFNIDPDELGPGYGRPTKEAFEAEVLFEQYENLKLDTTYTAKAAAALLRDARAGAHGKRLLYWLTLSSANLSTYVNSAPPISSRLIRKLRRTERETP